LFCLLLMSPLSFSVCIRMLSEMFSLPPLPDDQKDKKDEKTSPPMPVLDDDEYEYDPDSVDTNVTIMAILSRLNEDCQHLNRVNVFNIPPSLQYLLAVDISADTFVTLLEIIEGLSKQYFNKDQKQSTTKNTSSSSSSSSSEKTESEKEKELRLFAFIVCLRLLRINTQHLIEWNVDPNECLFGLKSPFKKKDSLIKRALSPSPSSPSSPSLSSSRSTRTKDNKEKEKEKEKDKEKAKDGKDLEKELKTLQKNMPNYKKPWRTRTA